MNTLKQRMTAFGIALTALGTGMVPAVVEAQYSGAGGPFQGYRSSNGHYHGPHGADKGSYRKSGRKSGGRNRKARSTRRQPAKRPASKGRRHVPVNATGSLSPAQDLYSDFGKDLRGGYTLEVKLVPVNKGTAPLVRYCRYNSADGDRSGDVKGIPAGRYTLTARTVAADKSSRAALVGTRCGGTLNPQGGDFASAVTVSFVQSKDIYGKPRVVSTPGSVWFRP